MKVRFVTTEQELVKDMTVNNLAKSSYVGFEVNGGRHMLCHGEMPDESFDGCVAELMNPQKATASPSRFNARHHLIQQTMGTGRGHFHVFDTAKELLLWMAEAEN